MSIQQTVSDTIKETTFVDCDTHLTFRSKELQAKKAKYMDEPYRSWLDPDADTYSGDSAHATLGRSFSEYGTLNPEVGSKPITSAQDLQEELCDRFYVDYPIINILSGINTVQDRERAQQEMRALNDMVIEHFLDDRENFFASACIAPQNPDKAAEEIDRLGDEKQIVGILLLPVGTGKLMGDPDYDVIYRAAEDNDLTVVYHSTSTAETALDFPTLAWKVGNWSLNHTLCHPMEHMMTLASLIFEGVPVKFPDLNFVFVEAGYEWVPWFMARMNREYAQRENNAPLLSKLPEEYVRECCYFGNQPLSEPVSPQHEQQLTEMLGADSIVGVTDFPHTDFDDPGALYKNIQRMDQDDIEKILHGNAIEAFGLDI